MKNKLFKPLFVILLILQSSTVLFADPDVAAKYMTQSMKSDFLKPFVIKLKNKTIVMTTSDMKKNVANPQFQNAYNKTLNSVNEYLSEGGDGCSDKKSNIGANCKKFLVLVNKVLKNTSNTNVGVSSPFLGISFATIDKELGTSFVNVFQQNLKAN